MSRPVVLVGGAGYIGQRLAPYLQLRGFDPIVVDPCMHCVPRFGPGIQLHTGDIELLLKKGIVPSGPIVYLAGLHDLPFWDELDPVGKREWQAVGRHVMVDLPLALAEQGREVIYISSMRALTHSRTFYGNLKRMAEKALQFRASIVRFGTVWGMLSPHLYNRTITVPNNWSIRGELPDAKWKAYITPMERAAQTVTFLLNRPGQCVTLNAIQPERPCVADDLRDFVPLLDKIPELMEREAHPAYSAADYYDLPLPKEKK